METTLFDGGGHAVAYIADDGENSIYLLSGYAVAYVVNEKIYGWNGHHLGWFINGVVYNLNGRKVGSIRERCSFVMHVEPIKHAKYSKYAKSSRQAPYTRPDLGNSYSDESFDEFLKRGAVGNV